MDRFDDVDYTVLEQPDPPRRARLQRWMLAPLASLVIIGSLAAGASAVTSDGTTLPAATQAEEPQKQDLRGHHRCKRGERDRSSSRLNF